LKLDLLAQAGDPDLRLLAFDLDPLPHLAAEEDSRRLALELDGHCSGPDIFWTAAPSAARHAILGAPRVGVW
jgi:hypothetical protein